MAAVGVAGGIAVLLGGGYFFRDYIQHFLNFFIVAVDEWGPLGYAAYAGVYIILEVSWNKPVSTGGLHWVYEYPL